MTQTNTKNLAKDELYKAILYFIERQQLVVQAMLEMKLDLNAIGKFASLGWVSSVSSSNGQKPIDDMFSSQPTAEIEQELYNVLKYAEEIKVQREGIWKDELGQEWNYFLHGRGCLLIHPETKEPIDWDCPNSKAFDDSFFYTHLDWQFSQRKNELQNIQELRNEIELIFAELLKDGLVEECSMPMGLVYVLKDKS
jgi:hypothetical protein